MIYERPDQKDWLFGGNVTEDGRYIIISVFQGTDTKNRVYYKDLQAKDAQVVKLLDDFDASYNFIGNDGNVFWFQTDLKAARGKIIAIDINKPDRVIGRCWFPKQLKRFRASTIINHMFVANYLKDAHTQVKIFNTGGKFVREVTFPGLGSASGFGGHAKDKETFYSYTGFTTPSTIYRYDMVTGKSSIFRQPKARLQS